MVDPDGKGREGGILTYKFYLQRNSGLLDWFTRQFCQHLLQLLKVIHQGKNCKEIIISQSQKWHLQSLYSIINDKKNPSILIKGKSVSLAWKVINDYQNSRQLISFGSTDRLINLSWQLSWRHHTQHRKQTWWLMFGYQRWCRVGLSWTVGEIWKQITPRETNQTEQMNRWDDVCLFVEQKGRKEKREWGESEIQWK